MRTWWGPPGGAAFILHREPRPDGTTGRVPILNVVGTDDFIQFVEDRAGHDQRYALDTDKIETLGWEPEYTFEEGLGRAVQYYLH